MTDLLQPAYSDLDPDAQALVERWAAELEGEPVETVTMFRFLVAMVAVKRGKLREVRRGDCGTIAACRLASVARLSLDSPGQRWPQRAPRAVYRKTRESASASTCAIPKCSVDLPQRKKLHGGTVLLTADYLTPDQVAARLHVTGETVRDWIRAGRLVGYRVGGRFRIDHEAYEAFVNAVQPQPVESVA